MFKTRDDRGERVRAYRLGVLESLLPQLVPRRARRVPADVLWAAYWRVLNSGRLWLVGTAVGIAAIALAILTGVCLQELGVESQNFISWPVAVYLACLAVGTMVYGRYVPCIAWGVWREVLLESSIQCPSTIRCSCCACCMARWTLKRY